MLLRSSGLSHQVLPLKFSFFMVRFVDGRLQVMGVLHKFVWPARLVVFAVSVLVRRLLTILLYL